MAGPPWSQRNDTRQPADGESDLKRNWKYIQHYLQLVETADHAGIPQGQALQEVLKEDIRIPGSVDEAVYALDLLIEEGLIRAEALAEGKGQVLTSLSWAGHDLLDRLRG